MNTAALSILFHDIIALITIINPIAAASIMISMIAPPTSSAIMEIAKKASLTIFIASLITLFGGEIVFKFFGINIYSIKIIGGVILMIIAINMAYGQGSKHRHSPEEEQEAQDKEDIAIVPIGIPILFGPGVIATIIVLSHNNASSLGTTLSYSILILSIFIASIVTYVTLRYAGTINKVLGITGIKILTRIMGLIVGAIAAQFLISGIKGLWGS
ncbi:MULTISPECIES: MarC family protein [unclassified Nitratiruptor]|uniref:MarC family protein n=1 Tax=unclassified Nitratiruptor TaxID=2624044 RepID=UPI00191506E0|nr:MULTISPECIES: MarC family protein [unclassified Nitratiruptor]BCD59343.1 multiple antibiotic resistance protein [Nitratiruptor sp. YY08-10]BCD63267.1 multiple antibiotic resistance protein [Nitratiruptor sp. YY08-14]